MDIIQEQIAGIPFRVSIYAAYGLALEIARKLEAII